MNALALVKLCLGKQRLLRGDVLLLNGEVYEVVSVDEAATRYTLRQPDKIDTLYMTYMGEHLGKVGEYVYEFPDAEVPNNV